MDLLLRGKNALVTGGSRESAGIRTVPAEEGCNVAINFRSDETREEFLQSSTAIRCKRLRTALMFL